jgi:hypothetical protein
LIGCSAIKNRLSRIRHTDKEDHAMAKRNLDTDGQSRTTPSLRSRNLKRAEFLGYANVTFDDAAKKRFEAWAQQEDLFSEALSSSVQDGWQFTLKTDTNSGAFMCTVSRWDGGHPSAGIILAVRGRDANTALWRCVWALTDYLAYSLLDALQPLSGADVW